MTEFKDISLPLEEDETEEMVFKDISIPLEEKRPEEVIKFRDVSVPDFTPATPEQEQRRETLRQWFADTQAYNQKRRKENPQAAAFYPRLPDSDAAAEAIVEAEKEMTRKRELLRFIEEREASLREYYKSSDIPERHHEALIRNRIRQMVEEEYGWEGYGKSFERLGQDKKETFSARDEYHGLIGSEDFVSPYKLFESIVTNPLSPSKWTAREKNPREKLRESLNSELIRSDGSVNLDSVFKSELPRAWQNQLMSYEMARQTGVPTEIWNNILQAKYAELPGSEEGPSVGKRVQQVLDSVVLNAWSQSMPGGAQDRIDALKKIPPPILIQVDKNKDGEWVFNMPGTVADGQVADFEGHDPTTDVAQRRLWGDFIEYAGSMVSDESTSNLADAISMAGEFTAGLFVGAPASTAAKVAAKASRAGRLASAGRLANSTLNRGYRVIQGDIPLISTIRGMSQAGRKMAYQTMKKSPRLAGALNAADRLLTVGATHAALAYLGAGEKSELDSALMAGTIGVALNLAPAIRSSFEYNILTKYPKAYKEIARVKDYDKLSSFTKNLVSSSGMSWEKIKADQKLFIQNSEMMLDAALKIENGVVETKYLPEFIDSLSKNAAFRQMADTLSALTHEGLSIEARYNKLIAMETADVLVAESRAMAAKSGTVASRGTASIDAGAVDKTVAKRIKSRLESFPDTAWTDLPTLRQHLEADRSTAIYADTIIDRIEDRGGGKNLAYHRMAAQMLQVGIIVRGAMADNVSPQLLLKNYFNVLAEPGEDVRRWWSGLKKEKDSMTVLDVRREGDLGSPLGFSFKGQDVKLHKVAPQATGRNILSNPERISEVFNITRQVLQEYADLGVIAKGSGVPHLTAGMKRRQIMLKHNERDFRRRTTMDLEEANKGIENSRNRSLAIHTRVLEKTAKLITEASARGVNDKKVTRLYRLIRTGNYRATREFDPVLIKLAKEADRSSNAWKKEQKRLIEWQARKEEIEQFWDTQDNKFIKDIYAFSGNTDEWEKLGLGDFKEIEGADYWTRLSNKISYELLHSIEETGIPIVSNGTLKGIRALERERFVNEVRPGLKPEEFKSVRRQAQNLSLALHRYTGLAAVMRDKIKIIEGKLSGIEDSPAKRAAALSQMQYVREAYRGIYGLKSFVKKYEDRLEDLAEKMLKGSSLDKAERKLLYTFTKSSPMTAYRLRAGNPDWVVPLSQETQSIFAAIEHVGIEAVNQFTDLVKARYPHANEVDSAIMAGRFLGLTRNFDASGWLGVAGMAGRYFRAKEDMPSAFDMLAIRQIMSSQNSLSTYLSQETSLGVDRVLSKYNSGLLQSKLEVQTKVLAPYIKELLSIPGYKTHPYGAELNRLMKRFSGYGKDFEWPMVDQQMTEFGNILWKVAVEKKDLDKIFAELNEKANKLSDRERVKGPQGGKQLTLRDARLLELERWERSIRKYWLPGMTEPKMWKMAFEIQRITQKWDRNSIYIFNQTVERLNKIWGTSFSGVEYNPYRLDGNVRKQLDDQVDATGANALANLSVFSGQVSGAYDQLMGTQLLGRRIASSKEGQLHKVSNYSEHDVDDVRNNFLLSRELLFQHVHTRDAMIELRELGIMLKDSGFTRHANAIARTALRQYETIAPIGIQRLVKDWIDSNHWSARMALMPPLRIAGAIFNPYQNLATPLKTFVDNPAQAAVAMAASSVNMMPVLPVDAAKFMVRFPLRIFSPKLSWLELKNLGGELPPEAKKAARDFVRSTAKIERDAFRRGKTLVNWAAGPKTKAAYWWGGRTINDPFSEQIYIRLKDNSEVSVKELVADHSIRSYLNAIEAANSLKGADPLKRLDSVRKELARLVQGVGVAADITDSARALVTDVDSSAPYRGLTGYMFQVDAAHLTRFDPYNVAPLAVSIDRGFPGFASFFNPIYNYSYRAYDLAANAFKSNKAESAFAAVLGLTAWAGWSWFIDAMQEMSDDGTSGLGEMPLLQRLDPFQIQKELAEGILVPSQVRTPASRWGSMEHRAAYEGSYRIWRLLNLSSRGMIDTHPDNQAEKSTELEEEFLSLLGLIERSSPLAFMQDLVGSPISTGWFTIAMDPEFVKHKIMGEILKDKTIQAQIDGSGKAIEITPEQQFVVDIAELTTAYLRLTLRIGTEDINPFSDEDWYLAQKAFRMALGKLGVGVENQLLYFFATKNRSEVETLLGLYDTMREQGEAALPAEEKPERKIKYIAPE